MRGGNINKEQEPEPLEYLTPQKFYLLVNDSIARHEGGIHALQNLMQKAEWGWVNNYRVHLIFDRDKGSISVELEEKPPIGF